MSTLPKKRATRVQATEITPGNVTVHFVVEGKAMDRTYSCACTKGAVRKALARDGFLCKARSITIPGASKKEPPLPATFAPTPEPMLPSVDRYHDPTWSTPTAVSDWDTTFGGMEDCMTRILPQWDDIPPLFQKHSSAWCHFWDKAFFEGTSLKKLEPVAGVDKTAAIRHLTTILKSMKPSHDHKIAAVAWLSFRWFKSDPPGGNR
jgi:hypothetical protein